LLVSLRSRLDRRNVPPQKWITAKALAQCRIALWTAARSESRPVCALTGGWKPRHRRIATPGFAASIAFDRTKILDGQALIVRRDGTASTIVE